MRFAIATVLVGITALTVDATAQTPAAPAVERVVLAGTKLGDLATQPVSFCALVVTIPANAMSHIAAGSNAIIYQLGGSTEITTAGASKTLGPTGAMFVAEGHEVSLKAVGNEPSRSLHFVLVRGSVSDSPVATEPAAVAELFRSPGPIPDLKPGAYEINLTRVIFPPRMAANAPHHRSGAALYLHSVLASLPGDPGPNRTQQASSHPHNAVFDPSGRFIAVPDKGLDRVFVFRLDAASGKLTPNDPPFVATRAGAGPRHIAFHPRMPLAYVVNELDSSVATYRFDAQRGNLQPIQIVPSIPADYTGNNTGAEIAVAPSGRVVYASNRGHDSIGTFAVDGRSGTLSPMGWAATRAKSPRFFGLDPAAKILYAANADEGFSKEQNTDTIVAFRIQANGMLTPAGQGIKTNSPCTIVFASV